jgi:hypothetical protein
VNNGDTTAAYMACHWNEILPATVQMASRQIQAQTAQAVASNKARPIENGLSSSAPSVVEQDFSKMNLKELRADNVIANNYLKDEFEEFALKTKIMSNVESPYFGIYIATAPNNQNVDKTTLAKVAQELVDVKGVKASFVIGVSATTH